MCACNSVCACVCVCVCVCVCACVCALACTLLKPSYHCPHFLTILIHAFTLHTFFILLFQPFALKSAHSLCGGLPCTPVASMFAIVPSDAFLMHLIPFFAMFVLMMDDADDAHYFFFFLCLPFSCRRPQPRPSCQRI